MLRDGLTKSIYIDAHVLLKVQGIMTGICCQYVTLAPMLCTCFSFIWGRQPKPVDQVSLHGKKHRQRTRKV